MQGDSDDTILALDIGTENVKAVIARQNESGGLDIIGIERRGRVHPICMPERLPTFRP